MVNIYKFCKKEIFIRPPGEQMTGRVDILWLIFEKNAKKLKMKSQEQKNVVFEKNAKKLKLKSQKRNNVVFG